MTWGCSENLHFHPSTSCPSLRSYRNRQSAYRAWPDYYCMYFYAQGSWLDLRQARNFSIGNTVAIGRFPWECHRHFSPEPWEGFSILNQIKHRPEDRRFIWWSNGDSNSGSPACKAGVLANWAIAPCLYYACRFRSRPAVMKRPQAYAPAGNHPTEPKLSRPLRYNHISSLVPILIWCFLASCPFVTWWGWEDLNLWPRHYQWRALTNWATAPKYQRIVTYSSLLNNCSGYTLRFLAFSPRNKKEPISQCGPFYIWS